MGLFMDWKLQTVPVKIKKINVKKYAMMNMQNKNHVKTSQQKTSFNDLSRESDSVNQKLGGQYVENSCCSMESGIT